MAEYTATVSLASLNNQAPVLEGFGAPVLFDNSAFAITNRFDISRFVAADDFVLGSAATLSEFAVYLADGVFDDDGVFSTFSGTLGWRIYADDGGHPGALMFSGADSAVNIVDTGLNSSNGRDIFRATAHVGSIDLTAGTYWLALREGNWGQAEDGSTIWWEDAATAVGAAPYRGTDLNNPAFVPAGGPHTLQIVADVPVVTFDEQAVNAGGQLLAPDVVFTDAEGNLASGTLTVTGLTPSDVLSIRAQGQIGVSGSDISFGPEVIGSFSGGTGNTFTVTFNPHATNVAVEKLIESLTFGNTSDAPVRSRVLTLDITDGDGAHLAHPLAREVRITPVNDAPALAANAGGTVVEGSSTTITAAQLHFSDAEQAAAAITYTVTATTNGTLRLNGSALALNGTFTQEDIDNNRVTFLHNGGETTTASFGFSVSDGAGGVVAGQNFTLTVTPVNDAPVLDGFGAPVLFDNSAFGPDNSGITTVQQANDFRLQAAATVSGFAIYAADGAIDDDGVFSTFSGTLGWRIYADNGGAPGAILFTGSTSAVEVADTGVNDMYGGDVFQVTAAIGSIALQAGTYWLGLREGSWASGIETGSSIYWQDAATRFGAPRYTGPLNSTPDFVGNITRDGALQIVADVPVVTFGEQAVNAGGQLLAPDVTFTDAEGNLAGGMLTVSGLAASDVVSIRHQGTGPGQIGVIFEPLVDFFAITFGGVVIAEFEGGNGNTLAFTFNGNATNAAVEALIENLTFANASDTPIPSRVLTLDITDGGGGALASRHALEVRITAENDAPVLTDNHGATVNEGSAATITAAQLHVNDPDQAATAITYTIAAATNGTVRLDGTPLGTNGTFTQDDIDHGRISFLHDGSETTSASFGFSVSDGAGGVVAGQSFGLTVTPVNDAPVLEVFGGPVVTFDEQAVNANAEDQLLLPDVTFTDAEGNLAGATLTVSGLGVFDIVAIHYQGMGPGQIGLANNEIRFGDVLIGTRSGGLGGTFTATFNANATAAAVEALIENLTFANVSDTPVLSRVLQIDIVDGAGAHLAQPYAREVRITPANDPPVLAANGGGRVEEGGATTVTGAQLRFSDVEQAATALTYTVTSATNGAVQLNGSALALNGTFTQDDIDNNRITFLHDGSETLSASFGFSVSDGAGGIVEAQSFDFIVTPLNNTAPALEGFGAPVLFDNSRYAAVSFNITTFVQASDFTLGSAATVTEFAVYLTDGAINNDGLFTSFSGTLGWRIYADNGGHPGTLLFSGADSAVDIVDTGADTAVSDIFRATVSVGSIDLAAGTYWVALREGAWGSPSDGTLVSWAVTSTTVGAVRHNASDINNPTFAPATFDGTLQIVADVPVVTFSEQAVSTGGQLLAPDVTFTDAEGNLWGATLTVSGLDGSDIVGIRDQGTGAGEIGISGLDITFGNVVIGSLSGGRGNTFTVIFNRNATNAAVESLVENLIFANTDDTPVLSRVLRLDITDNAGAHLAYPLAREVRITPENDPPVLTDNHGATVLEGGSTIITGQQLFVFDVEQAAAALTYTVTSLTNGMVLRNGSAVGVNGTFTQADLNSSRITFLHDGSETTSASFGFSVSDGAGGVVPGQTFDLTVTPTNDAPVLEGFGAPVLFDNSALGASRFNMQFVQTDDFVLGSAATLSEAAVYLTDGLMNDDGVFSSFSGTLGWRIYADNGGHPGALLFTGADSAVDVVDTGINSPTGRDVFRVTVDFGSIDLAAGTYWLALREGSWESAFDGSNMFWYGAATQTGGLRHTATNVNDPSFEAADGDLTLQIVADLPVVTFSEQAANAGQLLAPDVTLTDAEGNLAGGTLTVSGLTASDVVSIRNQGTGPGQIGVSGSSITFGNAAIGSFAGGSGNTFTVTLNANATSAAVDALIENLTFANTSDAALPSRVLTLDIIDGAGAHLAHPLALEVRIFPNDPPVLAHNTGGTVAEGGATTVTAGQLQFTDPEQAAAAVTYTVTSTTNGAVRLNDAALAVNGTFTQRDIDLGRVSFLHDGSEAASASFGFSVSDGVGGVVSGQSFALAVTPVNDAPVLEGFGAPVLFDNIAFDVSIPGSSRFNMSNTVQANDFVLGSAATVSDFAIYLADGLQNDDGVFSSFSGTIGWRIYADNGGHPGELLFTGASSAVDIVDTGINSPSSNRDIFRATVDIGSIDLLAGTYWLALREGNWGTAFDESSVFWEDAAAQVGAPRHNASNLNNPTFVEQDSDSTLQVLGDVPVIVFGEQAVNAGGQLLAPDVTFADAEGNLAGANLTVSGLAALDVLSIRNQGTGPGQIGVSGGDITFGNVVIGSFAGGSGSTFTVTFNGAATNAAVEALIENLTFANTDDTPMPSRLLTLDIIDGDGAHLANPLAREVRITPENDAPGVAGNDGGTVAEGGSATITAAQLRYTDPEQRAASAITYTVTSTTHGTVRLDGSALGVNGTFTQADIDNGRVSFLHDGSETASASFGFSVSDGAGGVVAAQSFAFTVTPTNDAPVLEGFGAPVLFDNIAFDVSIPGSSRFNMSNTVQANDFVLGSAATVSEFAVYLADGSQNDDGVFSGFGGTIGWRIYSDNGGHPGALLFTGASSAVDIVDTGINSPSSNRDIFRATVDIDSIELAAGTYWLALREGDWGTAFDESSVFWEDAAAQVGAPRHNASNLNSPTFVEQVSDSTLQILGDIPVVTFGEQQANAGQLLAPDVTFTDAEGNLAGATLTLSGLVPEDQISIRNQGTGAGQIGISGSTITFGNVMIGSFAGGAGNTFTVTLNANATDAAVEALIENLTFTNNDDTPVLNRVLQLDITDGAGAHLANPLAREVRIIENDPPVLADNDGGTVAEGESTTITAVQLRFTDPQQAAAAITYTVTSTANGAVRLNGAALAINGTFTQDDIDNGRVSFLHDGSETTSASFGFSVSDGLGGIVEAQSFALTVTPVNDAPVLDANTDGTVAEGVSTSITAGQLRFTDPEQDASAITYTVTSTTNGTVRLNGAALAINGTFTQDDIDNGLVSFLHDGSETTSASFGFSVSDGAGGLVETQSFALTVTPVNDDPVVAVELPDRTSAVNQPVNITIPAGTFSDPDDTLILTATLANGDSLPGTLTFDGTTITGKPPQNFFGDLEIKITANDGEASVSDTFRLTISNAGNDVLVSGPGPNSTGVGNIFALIGGAGDDVYAVADEEAGITEEADEGADTVYATVTYTLPTNVEGMVLQETAGAIDGFGSDGNDTIFGNSFSNWLHGGEGSDALIGGGGNDVLFGEGGIDGMAGGAGDDTYVVDNTFDQIQENAGAGADTIYAGASFTLPDNVEGLVLLEDAGAIDGFGSEGNDTIIGNSSNNVLDGRGGSDALIGAGGNDVLIGGAGIDGMAGGQGDDTYGVDNTLDQIQENAEEGADTVYASATFTLTANLEALVLVDSAGAIDGTGNGEDNYLFGNSSANTLHGQGGNDVVFGGAGADILHGDGGDDVLTGGADDDRFVFGVGFGRDSIADFNVGDHIVFSPAVFANFAAVQAHMVEIDAGTTAIVLDGANMLAVHHAPGVALTQNDFLFS